MSETPEPARKAARKKPPRSARPRHGPPPGEAGLNEAALSHLARFGTTRAGLLRVLERRIDRWARETGADPSEISSQRDAARAAAKKVVERLAAAGAVDDSVFAASRARKLVRSGRSRRAVSAHLSARGVGAEEVSAALGGDADDNELAAALATARRRHAGPFRAGDVDEETRRKELGALARAGFSQEIARRALAMDLAEAEQRVERLKRG